MQRLGVNGPETWFQTHKSRWQFRCSNERPPGRSLATVRGDQSSHLFSSGQIQGDKSVVQITRFFAFHLKSVHDIRVDRHNDTMAMPNEGVEQAVSRQSQDDEREGGRYVEAWRNVVGTHDSNS